jgi:hypothetical protein
MVGMVTAVLAGSAVGLLAAIVFDHSLAAAWRSISTARLFADEP